MAKQFNISINGTFVIDPILTSLRYWSQYQPLATNFTVSTYNHLFQDLLSESVLRNKADVVIICVRYQDWLKGHNETGKNELDDNVNLFSNILLSANQLSSYLVILCPSDSKYVDSTLHDKFHKRLLLNLKSRKNIKIYCANKVLKSYDFSSFTTFNEHTEELGHMPYTQNYYDMLGVIISQKLYQLYMYDVKVIVLDCDNTLWGGVCGEVGWENVKISNVHQKFQKKLVKLHDAGVLLCLCSKNNIYDVKNVFEKNPLMILKWSHFVSYKINWHLKSINISEISSELNIGLENFLFFDDNEVEVEEVKVRLSQMTVLHIPSRDSEFLGYINKSWVLEKLFQTNEDEVRTNLYRRENLRLNEIKQAPDLLHFFKELDLQVTLDWVKNSDVSRVSQLCHRTNQFNFAKREHSPQDIVNLMNDNKSKIRTIYVSDRFGEYGLVGVIFYHDINNNLRRVDNFLLSCRVLGRGVEHQVIKSFAEESILDGVTDIEFYFIDNEKNVPAREFKNLLQITSEKYLGDGILLQCSLNRLLEINFDPYAGIDRLINSRVLSDNINRNKNQSDSIRKMIQNRESILMRLHSINNLRELLYGHYFDDDAKLWGIESKKDKVVQSLIRYFQQLLQSDTIDSEKNILTYGISSLKIVQIIGLIYENYNVTLPYSTLNNPLSINELADEVLKLVKARPREQSPHYGRSEKYFYHLSNQQDLIFSKEMLEKNRSPLNVSTSHRLKGKLNVEKLHFALNSILKNNEALSSNFILRDNDIVQKFKKIGRFPFKIYQSKYVLSSKNNLEIDQWIKKFTNKRFKVNHGVLCRAGLLKISDNEHILTLCFHHLLIDEWSLRILYRDLALYFNESYLAKSSDHRTVQKKYSEYILMQKDTRFDEDEQYWLKKLSNINTGVIPFDNSINKAAMATGSILFNVPESLYFSLVKNRVFKPYSLFVTYMASMLINLRFHLNVNTPHIATAFANRNNPQFQNTIGLFTQVFPITCTVTNEDNFFDILKKVQSEVQEASLRSEISLSKVFGLLGLQPNIRPHPFFQIAMLYYPDDQHPLILNDINTEPYTNIDQYSQFDIVVILREKSNSMTIEFQFNKINYHGVSIERLANHYLNILNQLVTCPEIKIKDLSILSHDEVATLVKWSKNKSPHFNRSLLNILRAQINKYGNKTAVQSTEQVLTYKELDMHSTVVAQYLNENIQFIDNHRIIVMMDNSVDYIVAILAILKINATFVTFDPKLPLNRLMLMYEQINAKHCLVSRKYFLKSKSLMAQTFVLEDILTQIMPDVGFHFNSSVIRKDMIRTNPAAAILFTSGTQGIPKPTMISDTSIVQISKNLSLIKISPDDNIAQFTRLTFDVSLFEIWSALLNGATLSIINPNDKLNYAKLFNLIRKFEINCLTLTTSHFNAMVFNYIKVFKGINRLIIGGEQLKADAVSKLINSEIAPKKIYHAYGVTEVTAISLLYRIPPRVYDPIPIGYPCCGITAIVLNEYGKLSPIGTWGELYLSGDAISQGYINCEEENKIKFLELSLPEFSDDLIRVYRTGDKARFINNGALEFGGRIDRQIKLRGYRIELEDIEKVYLSLPEIQNVVVQPIKQGNETNLVAYIKLEDKLLSTWPQLLRTIRSTVSSWLPQYMIPQNQYAVTKIPLTSHGKIDVNNIYKYIAKSTDEEVSDNNLTTKNDAVLQSIKKIWLDLLGVDDCNYDTNFFDLGGNSLLFTILLAKVQDRFLVVLATEDVLIQPTIRNFSIRVKHSLNVTSNYFGCIQPIKMGASETLVIVHPVSGLITNYYTLAQYLNMNIIGIVSPTLLDESIRFNNISELAKFYLGSLMKSQFHKRISLAGWSFGGLVALEMSHIAKQLNVKIDQVYLFDTYHPTVMNDLKINAEIIEVANETKDVANYHIKLVNNYQPQYDGMFYLVEASENNSENDIKNDRLGWSKMTDANYKHIYVQGNHNDMFSHENVDKICNIINETRRLEIEAKILSLQERFREEITLNKNEKYKSVLSRREAEVAINLLNQRSLKEMARTLGLSYRTVESILMNVRYKFGVNSTIELIDNLAKLLRDLDMV